MKKSPRCFPALLLLALGAALPAPAAEPGPLIAALRAVGPEAAGHEEASRAWAQLARAPAGQLPEILAGMDGANPLAANWLALAAGAVAERATASGEALPAAELEQFFGDRRHAPRARYLAYEWVAAARPADKRRLLAGALDDPSLEVRREAVEQALGDAVQIEELGDFAKALPAYRKALTAARDPDQIRQIADRLRKGGETVDLQRHFGFLARWKLIGPFDNADGKGYDAEYPPEKEIDPAAEYPGKHGPVKWVEHATEDEYGVVDLNKVLVTEKDVAGYATTEFRSAGPREVQVRITSPNAVKLWLNGRLLAAYKAYHSGSQLDQYVVPAKLEAGRNVLLLKVCQNNIQQDWARYWQFQLRVCDEQGTAVLPDQGTAQTALTVGGDSVGAVGGDSVGDPGEGRAVRSPTDALSTSPAESPPTGPAGDWRQFRGTWNNPVSAGAAPPVELSPEKNLAWRVELPGRGPAGPIVAGGRVIVTASGGPRQDQLHVLCFDAASGRKLWQRRFWATGSTACNPFGAVAAPTPASDGRLVFAFYSSNDLACFDLEGNLRWLRGLGHEHPLTRNDVGMASSPLVVGGAVVVQCETFGDSFAAGLDAATGKTRWRMARERSSMWASPALFRSGGENGDLVLMHSRSALTAHDPATGRVVWEHRAGCHSMASSVAVDGRVYLPGGGMQALLPDPGTPDVKVLWREPRLACGAPSPAVHQGRIYTIKDPGILVCGDAAGGRVLWQLRLQGPVWATPAVAGGHLYCVNHAGLVQVVKLPAAAQQGEVVGTCQLDRGMLASPAAVGGAIYFRSDAHLWKFAAPVGQAFQPDNGARQVSQAGKPDLQVGGGEGGAR